MNRKKRHNVYRDLHEILRGNLELINAYFDGVVNKHGTIYEFDEFNSIKRHMENVNIKLAKLKRMTR